MSREDTWTSNVLIVEDEPAIASYYVDLVKEVGGHPWPAETLDEANRLIAEVAFGVALVDLCLSKTDGSNRDGLIVLETLSKKADGTRTTLITARGDFLGARDALARFGAVEAFDKDEATERFLSEYVPAEIKAAGALAQRSEGMRAYALKPDNTLVLEWERRLQAACKPTGDIGGLYEFWDKFLSLIMPLRVYDLATPLKPIRDGGMFLGAVWSRGRGHAVGIGLTDKSQATALKEELSSPSHWEAIGAKPAGSVELVEARGVVGGIVKLDNATLEQFHSV